MGFFTNDFKVFATFIGTGMSFTTIFFKYKHYD